MILMETIASQSDSVLLASSERFSCVASSIQITDVIETVQDLFSDGDGRRHDSRSVVLLSRFLTFQSLHDLEVA